MSYASPRPAPTSPSFINVDKGGHLMPTSAKEKLTWQELKGPISVTFACFFGMLFAMLDEKYFKTELSINSMAVISSILLLMDMDSSERFYISITFRIAGTIVGISLGLALSILEDSLVTSAYKDPEANIRHEDDWKLIFFRVCVLVPIIFACTIMMRAFPKYAYPFVVLAVQTPAGLFAPTMKDATSSAMSSVLAIIVAIFSIVAFENKTTATILMETNKKAINGVLAVVRLSIRADAQTSEEFLSCSEQVHKSISTTENSISTYTQWRSISFRKISKDYFSLVKPLRPLFYQAYSLYWGNAQSFRADHYSASSLFCDTEDLYRQYFAEHVDLIEQSFSEIATELDTFYTKTFHTDEEVTTMMHKLVEGCMWKSLVTAQERIRSAYYQYRGICFGTFAQRCNVTDFIYQICMMSLALVEYFRAITDLFIENEDEEQILFRKLEELSMALDDMRKIHDPWVLQNKSETRASLGSRGSSPISSPSHSMRSHLGAGTFDLSSPTGEDPDGLGEISSPSAPGAPDPEEVMQRVALLRSGTRGGL